MAKRTRQSRPKAEAVLDGPCPACQTATLAEANFCHQCGAALRPAAPPASRRRQVLLLMAAVVIALGVTAGGAFLLFAPSTQTASVRSPSPVAQAAPAQPSAPPSALPSAPVAGQPPDLSTMTPREAADRLFNRVMAASEKGDVAEARRFAPMAAQAYDRVRDLDHDGLYHQGLIYLVLGDFDNARKRAAAVRLAVPNHLLATVLAHTIATRSNDAAGVALARAEFDAAYAGEMLANRPEYTAHRNTIDAFRTPATPAAVPASTVSAADPPRAFIQRCAVCHGPTAAGTKSGPPLVHKTYEPSHHGDDAFFRAVAEGVKAHHWSFGNMPPVPGLSRDAVQSIIAYVRRRQVAEGIR